MSKILIVVDMQEGFRYKNVERIIPKIKMLLDKAGTKAIFTKFVDKRGSAFDLTLHWSKFVQKKNQNLLREFAQYSKCKTITHKGLNIVTKNLYRELGRRKATAVYLCGVYSDVSIGKAAMDFFDKKIDVKIIEDAVTSQNAVHDKYVIASLRRVIGKQNVVKLDDVVI